MLTHVRKELIAYEHDIESCNQGGEDQDKTWLDGLVASVKGKLSDDLAPMDRSNSEEQVKSRSMNQYGHMLTNQRKYGDKSGLGFNKSMP